MLTMQTKTIYDRDSQLHYLTHDSREGLFINEIRRNALALIQLAEARDMSWACKELLDLCHYHNTSW